MTTDLDNIAADLATIADGVDALVGRVIAVEQHLHSTRMALFSALRILAEGAGNEHTTAARLRQLIEDS